MKDLFTLSKEDRKLAVLVDPDKLSETEAIDFIPVVHRLHADVVLIGGSLVVRDRIDSVARSLKSALDVPLVLFPGHFTQLTDEVDAVLLLNLISGRNADLLIGQHVLAAPRLIAMKDKVHSTGYMLIDGGNSTSVGYMSNTLPIPRDKSDIAVCTAQAGELIGMKFIYLDAGSGAQSPIPLGMVRSIAKATSLPIIVGGGVRNQRQVEEFHEAGANMVVVGNALENNSFVHGAAIDSKRLSTERV